MTMTTPKLSALTPCFFIIFFFFVAGPYHDVLAAPSGCTTAEIDSQMKDLYNSFLESSRTDGNLLAGYIRGGFHDCATAIAEKPKSGCNGSLRSEGDVFANIRLQATIESVTSKKNALAPCVSFADSFLLAYSAGVKAGADLSIVPLLVDASTPREDFADGETDKDSEDNLNLPSPRDPDIAGILKFYTDRKMTLRDLVVSNAIGHSFGSVRSFSLTSVQPLRNFSITPHGVGPFYVAHLLWRFSTESETDLNGFFTLSSDQSLVADAGGREILNSYAKFRLTGSKGRGRGKGKSGGTEGIRMFWSGSQARLALRDFQVFSVKMSQLSDKIITGEDSFAIPSEAFDLKRESAGWDGPKDLPYNGRNIDQTLNPDLSDLEDQDKPWSKVGPNFFKNVFTKVP